MVRLISSIGARSLDSDSVAALESELDAAIVRVMGTPPPSVPGAYTPCAPESEGPDPYVHAVPQGFFAEYPEAENALEAADLERARVLSINEALRKVPGVHVRIRHAGVD